MLDILLTTGLKHVDRVMRITSANNYCSAYQVKQQVVCLLAVASQKVLNLTRRYGLVSPKKINDCPQ
ncbi:hypothetical protein LMT12_16435 [Escherichia coli]|uniref:hypothetical protein n=1 Tax=Escherichia coli TaxID=562 RepID=UPI0019F2B680|nr:hypothetical protein [Escherichia coli]EGP0066519.1 hypothetical protein [Escherichia coli]MCC5408184.1 hypothetical protein [Escherichia coli]MCC5414255.1 hypothetical protein [Escherichia coli]